MLKSKSMLKKLWCKTFVHLLKVPGDPDLESRTLLRAPTEKVEHTWAV